MEKLEIQNLVEEIIQEQHAIEDEETLEVYIKEAEYDINYSVGYKINYETDLSARSLLKNYVLYSRYKRLAEFKQIYGGEYALLQAKYYKPSEL